MNTFAARSNYDENLGRDRSQYLACHWVKGVTIDGLHSAHHLPKPDYVKIDVDGMEDLVVKGALETLQSRHVKAWCIEVTGESRISFIQQVMRDNGYLLAGEFEHYPGLTPRTLDYVFVRSKELLASWRDVERTPT